MRRYANGIIAPAEDLQANLILVNLTSKDITDRNAIGTWMFTVWCFVNDDSFV